MRRRERVRESLAFGQERADRGFEHVVDPCEREVRAVGVARDGPAVEPGERAFVRNRIADVGAGTAQQLHLLRAVVAEHQRRAMFDEQRGRFFGERVVREQIAAQVDQLARDDERLRRCQAKRIAIAERERGKRKLCCALLKSSTLPR